jgi:hypothetical protein
MNRMSRTVGSDPPGHNVPGFSESVSSSRLAEGPSLATSNCLFFGRERPTCDICADWASGLESAQLISV